MNFTSFYPIRLLLKRLGLCLIAYTFVRGVFLLNNWGAYSKEPVVDLGWAFLHGIRFDMWTLAWVFLPFILLSLLPWRWQKSKCFQQSLLVYFLTINFVFLALNFFDAEWFKFTGKRVTLDWFRLQQDLRTQFFSMLTYYWFLALLFFFTIYLLYRFYPKANSEAQIAPYSRIKRAGAFAVVILGLFVAMRGGFQYKPLGLNHAYAQPSANLGTLTINSTFSLIKNRKIIQSLNVKFFNDPQKAYAMLRIHENRGSKIRSEFKGFNVVLIVVESLASEYVGALNPDRPSYTPFLDELAQRAYLFKRNFANGRRSIEAMPSLLCAFPSMMSEALILSPYQGLNLECLGHTLKQEGYRRLFFHGAYNGSMYMDSVAKRMGFETFYGFNEFPDPQKDDGSWGVFDEPMLLFAAQELGRNPGPFASVIFTLSSHHPYRVPREYDGRFNKGTLEIHESIGYVDHSLREFFKAAEKTHWFDRTIFIITGDHTHKSDDPNYADPLGAYKVPLFVYIPSAKKMDINLTRITQHVDIFPTVLDLLGINPIQPLAFGESVFSESMGLAFSGLGNGYFLASSNYQVVYNSLNQRFSVEAQDTTSAVADHDLSAREAVEGLKARIEYFNWAVINNKFNSSP